MTKAKNTKRALLLSVLSLMLCMAMLVGSTFAWFTDNVTSGVNRIVAGNLDVELEYSLDGISWTTVDEETNMFKEDALWEPGYTEVVYLQVKNVGSLALKYQFGINVADKVIGKTADDKDIDLAKFIKFGVVEANAAFADRAAARNAVKDTAGLISAGYSSAEGHLTKESTSKMLALVVYMPEEVGNDANHGTGKTQPTIYMGINLVATQDTVETDSFGKDYDKNASYDKPWDGTTVDTAWYSAEATSFTLSKPEELAGLASLVNAGTTFEGKTVTLTADVSLGDKEWTPIGNMKKPFMGTFNGNGHTISNIAINTDCNTESTIDLTVGFFGYAENAEISDLKLDGLLAIQISEEFRVNTNCYIGGICAVAHNTVIERCTNSIDFDASTAKIGDLKHYFLAISGICTMGINVESPNYSGQTYIRNCLNEGDFELLEGYAGVPISVGITLLTSIDPVIVAENCINVGRFTVKDYSGASDELIGGIALQCDSGDVIKNCYSANIVPIADPSEEGVANEITSAEDMAKQSTFVGFDFDNVWELTNGKYPTLRK